MNENQEFGKLESSIENIVPKKLSKSVKKLPALYLSVFLVLVCVTVLLAVYSVTTSKNLNHKTVELSSLQSNLNKTKAGQAALEEAENQANNKAEASQAQATSEAASLSSTQSQLSSSQAQLDSVNTRLASAQACVSLFDTSVSPNIGSFNTDMSGALYDATESITDALAGDYTDGTTLLEESQTDYNSAQNTYSSIKDELTQISSGYCG